MLLVQISQKGLVKSPFLFAKWEAVVFFFVSAPKANNIGTVSGVMAQMAQGHSAKVHVATHQRRAQGRSAAATDQGQEPLGMRGWKGKKTHIFLVG